MMSLLLFLVILPLISSSLSTGGHQYYSGVRTEPHYEPDSEGEEGTAEGMDTERPWNWGKEWGNGVRGGT